MVFPIPAGHGSLKDISNYSHNASPSPSEMRALTLLHQVFTKKKRSHEVFLSG